MADGWIPVMRTVGTAYHDMWRVVHAMPQLVLLVAAIGLVFDFTDWLVIPTSFKEDLATYFAISALRDLLTMPLLIAVHRFILIDEVTGRYAIEFGRSRFLRFFAWWVALNALPVGLIAIERYLSALPGVPPLVMIGLFVVAIFLVAVLVLHLTILFPAIAVEAPGATASNAIADARGHGLNILLIVAVTLLPFVVLAVIDFMDGRLEYAFLPDSDVWRAASIVIWTVLGLASSALLVAIVSRIFQALADRLARSPA